jgi:hypothetical protein
MGKNKNKKPQMAFLLQNDLQLNVIQVAIDHMIEHLTEVVDEAKGEERNINKERLREAYGLKEIFESPERNVLPLEYANLLRISRCLKAEEKELKALSMKKEKRAFGKLREELKTVEDKCSYSSLAIIY